MRALWDFSLRRTLSLEVLGAIYKVLFFLLLGIAGVVELSHVVHFFGAIGDHYGPGPGYWFLMFLITPVLAALLVLGTRLSFELLAAIFRIADATEHTARQGQQQQRLF